MPNPLGFHAAVLLVAIISMGVFYLVGIFDDLNGPSIQPPQVGTPSVIRPVQPEQLPGSIILKNYASNAQTPQQDLTDVSHVFSNFSVLVKGDRPLPLGANEEIAAALKGKNKVQLRFLSDDAPCFNAQGQIVDRWQTPLFFHALDKDRIDIRSAGPDKKMWTDDDIHRHYDGQFIRGEALNSPSLFEATKDYRGQ